MIYQSSCVNDPFEVCKLLKELNNMYKSVEIISVTQGANCFYVFYKIGEQK
jgi:hypothetical protein